MKLCRCHTVIFIVGPTAIGKTRLAIRLAGRLKGEIVSSDSMQVYKGMRILSQAPAASQMRKVRHHLIGLLDPNRDCNVAYFRRKAAAIISRIVKRGRIPIVVGGSGLYVKALIDGLFPSPEADPKFRRTMERLAGGRGNATLYKRLTRIDPYSASRIHPNDTRRIIRALEIFHSTGKTMTELKALTKGLKERYDIKAFGLIRRREKIYSGIDSRTEMMFEEGIVDEVKALRRKKLSKTAKAVLGFNEISGYLDGEYDMETCKAMMKMNTRRFAKRQLTWFRADPRITWLDLDRIDEEAAVRKIARQVRH